MKSQKTNWWIDAVLYAGFLLLFFLNITGVDLHQWLGLGIGILVLVHLVLHMDWVEMVVSRFFGKTSSCARINLIIDALLGMGFFLILTTGLIISSWLNLTFIDYAAWSNLHTLVSVVTLFTLLVKLILHRKWIVSVTEKCILGRNDVKRVPADVCQTSGQRVNRREFLKVGAIMSAGAVIGVVRLHDVVENIAFDNSINQILSANNQSSSSATNALVNSTSSMQAGSVTDPKQISTPDSTVQTTAQPTVQATAIPTTAPTTVTASSQPAAACTIRCPRGCSYPGRCRRYTDSNNNGKCDLGECI